jgi:hypothetical protein
MKLFAIAFGITCGVSAGLFILVFALLSLFESSQAVSAATGLAGLSMAAFPKVAESLEHREGRKSVAGGARARVYDFRGFQIAWPVLVAYGTVVLWGVVQAFGFIIGFAFGTATGQAVTARALQGLAIAIIAVMIVAAYFVGRWIGSRTSRLGIAAMLLISPLFAVTNIATDVLLLPGELYRDAMGSEPGAFFGLLWRIIGISLVIMVPGLIGYWRGQKQRLSKYLHYLLSVLPPQTRETVVELAFEEAQKVSAVARDARPSIRPEASPVLVQPLNLR